MAISIEELKALFNRISPEDIAESWDHSGVQIDAGRDLISRILICLDVTADIVEEAIKTDTDLILSHHPLIFNPLYAIENQDYLGGLLVRLIKSNISVYAMHTAFDSVKGGNNDYLAEVLDLTDIQGLAPGLSEDRTGLGRRGKFTGSRTLEETVAMVKHALDIRTPIAYVGDPRSHVKHVAICTGSGASQIVLASQTGCDVLITGDVGYHDALKAKAMGLSVIDAGHFHSEKIFVRNVAEQLKVLVENKIEILASQTDQNPFNML